jgi:hypothetical protein
MRRILHQPPRSDEDPNATPGRTTQQRSTRGPLQKRFPRRLRHCQTRRHPSPSSRTSTRTVVPTGTQRIQIRYERLPFKLTILLDVFKDSTRSWTTKAT